MLRIAWCNITPPTVSWTFNISRETNGVNDSQWAFSSGRLYRHCIKSNSLYNLRVNVFSIKNP